MKKYKIAVSPLTNKIYIGKLDKNGREWKDKEEATIESLTAVMQHILQNIKNQNCNTVVLMDEDTEYMLTLTTKKIEEEK